MAKAQAGDKAAAKKANEILEVAQHYIQTRGYNGFSFRDLAGDVGIKSASVHYHFPTKGDLGRVIAARYIDQFDAALAAIDAEEGDPRVKLSRYAALYRDTLVVQNRLCLCGVLASEIATLPEGVKGEVVRFFETQRAWLRGVIAAAAGVGAVKAEKDPDHWAVSLLAALEGAMLVARATGEVGHFDKAVDLFFDSLFETAES